MLSPVTLFIFALAVAFLLPLFDRLHRTVAYTLLVLTLGYMAWLPLQWLTGFLVGTQQVMLYTAGLRPPVAIVLRMGGAEAFVLFLVNLSMLLGAFYLHERLRREPVQLMLLYLALALGLTGIVLTRDLFNLFVFIEIASIASYGLVVLEPGEHTLAAGFKYAVAGGLSSLFLLLGVVYLYRFTGTLWLDEMLAAAPTLAVGGGFIAVFLTVAALLIELKPWPANGWALDVYQTAHPGLAALFSAATSGAMLMALYKLLPLLPHYALFWMIVVGIVTFVASNMAATRQENTQRLLGYSSVGQVGLIVAVMSLYRYFGLPEADMLWTAGTLFAGHLLAKAGLFWLAGIVNAERLTDWGGVRRRPDLLFLFGMLLFALAGFPPFPGFWGKWRLVMELLSHAPIAVAFVLFGSLVEAYYLFRWFGQVTHAQEGEEPKADIGRMFPLLVTEMLLVLGGLQLTRFYLPTTAMRVTLPLLGGLLLFVVDRLPGRFKGTLTLMLSAAFFSSIMPDLSPLSLVFGFIFLAGGALLTFGTMRSNDKRPGFYPLLMTLLLALGSIVRAEDALSFFLAWEWMTLSSWLLVLRGKRAEEPALTYLMFSLGAALMMMAGFGMVAGGQANFSLPAIFLSEPSLLAMLLVAAGMLIKSGALGVHVWLPNAYVESDDDFTPFLSALLSKAGIFGLMLFSVWFGVMDAPGLSWADLLSWIGILTAFFGALMAVFQEDLKRLLAYSSMSQVGYIILCVSLYTQLGWLAALYLAVLHFLFKGLLFLVAAGVIQRTGVRNMYEMGGLIKRMPLSFISALIAIITLSGVPPLAGFGSKWLIYQALLEKGWYLQAGLAFFASTIAFLYLFRFIHAVFLGQLKTHHRTVQEASVWVLLPQYVIIGTIMAASMFPRFMVRPLEIVAAQLMPGETLWSGNTLLAGLGYWNGNLVMNITIVVFMLVLLWLLLWTRRIQKVGQFNIVFAAERPQAPETTHYAYNFFPFYRKALGFLIPSSITRFWRGAGEWTLTLGEVLRQFYTGNAQTYALQIMLYVTVLYFLTGV